MKKSPLVLLFSFSLLLAACGGGGSGGSGGSVVPPSNGGATPTPVPPATATPRATATPTPTPMPTATPVPGVGLSGPRTHLSSWGPPAIAQDLDFPVQHGYNGSGQTIAVVIDSDVSRTDLSAFLQYFQIPATGRTITSVPVPPLTSTSVVTANGQNTEATLDVETVAGLAPGANIIIYQVKDLGDQNLINAYDKIVSDGKAFIVNNSFGGCEYSNSAIDPVLQSAAQRGIVFMFSSGDSGNVCDNTTNPMTVGPGYPADNPYVLGISGNETRAGTSLTSSVVWNDNSCTGGQCAAGGGVSGIYTIPSYQQGLAGAVSQTHRNEPDFSMPAEDVASYYNSGWHTLLGTSWSAPEAAALFAQLYQYCGANGGAITGVTNPATIPYYVASQGLAANYTDVTSGNDQFNSTTPYYVAGTGYDDAAGFGVPKGYAFAQTACPNHTPAGTLAARSSFSTMSTVTAHPAQDLTIDITPHMWGLADQGVRSSDEATNIQFVLQPSANAASGEAAVVSALQSAGFRITKRFSNHLVVDAVAPAGYVNRYFRTSLHNVAQGRYGLRYLPATQIVVPAAIAPYVAGVSLDNVVRFHTPLP